MDLDLRDGNRGSWHRPFCGFPLWRWLALASGGGGFHRVKCIAQRNLVDVAGVWIILDLRIYEKHHRHIDPLTGLQRLLGEAEALDLLEIFAGLVGRDVVGGLAGPGPATQVLRAVVDLGLSAGLDLHARLLGLEAPRQARVHIGVEANRDPAGYRTRRPL